MASGTFDRPQVVASGSPKPLRKTTVFAPLPAHEIDNAAPAISTFWVFQVTSLPVPARDGLPQPPAQSASKLSPAVPSRRLLARDLCKPPPATSGKCSV